jgi:hypothetical protein
MVDLVTLGIAHRSEHIDFDEDDDMLSVEDEDGGEEAEDALEQDIDDGEAHDGLSAEEEDDQATDNGDANDYYDELGQTVLQSQSNMPDEDDPDFADEDRHIEDGEEAEKAEDEQDGDETTKDQAVQEQLRDGPTRSQRAAEDELAHVTLPANTQRSAIADSQTESSRKRRQQAPLPLGPNSSITSFIPGSQYAGMTSQELAFIRRVHSDSQGISSAERVPSSPPPMPGLNTEGSSNDTGVMAAQTSTGDVSHQHYEEPAAPQDSRLDMNEIPESEYTEHENTIARQQSNINNILNSVQEGSHSNNALPYSTARAHVSSASPSPAKHEALKMATIISTSQMSRPSQFSPRKAAGVRRFGDMTTDDLMPMNNSGTTYDEMTSIMNGVLGDDHDLFAAIADSPVKKKSVRRPLAKATPEFRSSVPEVASVPIEENSEVPVISASQSRLEQPHSTAEEASSPVRPTAKRRKHVPRVPSSSLSVAMEVDETAPTEHVEAATPIASIPAIKTGLENMFSPSSPTAEAAEGDQPGLTPASVRKREEAGARVVDQLLSSRSRKLPSAGKKLKAMRYGHAAIGKAKGKASAAKKMKAAKSKAAPVEENANDEGEQMELDVSDTVDPTHEALEGDMSEVTDVAINQALNADQADAEVAVLAPRRMFAVFTGNKNNYYPATWIATSADGLNHQVRFDDMAVTAVSAKQACRLDLRVGDVVKVDLPQMRQHSWTVVGLAKTPQAVQSEILSTDIFGHTHVKVQTKARRTSLANAHEALEDGASIKEVPISCIYLTLTMWTPFQDRLFQIHDGHHSITRMETPSATSTHTPSGRNTPSTSRLVRARVPTIKAEEKLAHLSRDEPISFAVKSSRPNGVFNGMAFAISYISSEPSAEKAEVLRLIELGGGKILEAGFEELFLLPGEYMDNTTAQHHLKRPSISTTPIKPSSTAIEAKGIDPPFPDGLLLRPEVQTLGFVALIADHHSRRAKYMQALALGLPTLAGRWILDSWASSQNLSPSTPPSPLPWSRYLLPSGESNFLNNAVRSRTLLPYHPTDPSQASLASVIARRPVLLKGEGVLMVAPSKKGSAGWEKRKTFIFLTLALGAGRVRRVADVKEARRLVEEDSDGVWRWVYMDCALGEAARVLFGKEFSDGNAAGSGRPAGGGEKKRKKGGGFKDENGGDGTAAAAVGGNLLSRSDGKVMLVNDEFVVQSLILGDLIE